MHGNVFIDEGHVDAKQVTSANSGNISATNTMEWELATVDLFGKFHDISKQYNHVTAYWW